LSENRLFFIIIVLSLYSCDKKQNNIRAFKYSIIYNRLDTLELNINKKNKRINFDYEYLKDSKKNLSLKYNTKEGLLISSLDTFVSSEKIYNFKDLEFKIYKTKELRSHNRIIVFNENYGILANLAYGSDHVFLRDSLSKNEAKVIFKELIFELNKN